MVEEEWDLPDTMKPSNGEDNNKLIVCEETSETKQEDPIVGKVPLPT